MLHYTFLIKLSRYVLRSGMTLLPMWGGGSTCEVPQLSDWHEMLDDPARLDLNKIVMAGVWISSASYLVAFMTFAIWCSVVKLYNSMCRSTYMEIWFSLYEYIYSNLLFVY